jgi:tetrahydromethanopterin S-methyltransferase subunit G
MMLVLTNTFKEMKEQKNDEIDKTVEIVDGDTTQKITTSNMQNDDCY